MENNSNHPSGSGQPHRSLFFHNEKQTILEYLREHTVTASMLSEMTGIKQKNICRYKRDLEKGNLLWETEKRKCKITGCYAWYLTTDPAKAPSKDERQLKMPF